MKSLKIISLSLFFAGCATFQPSEYTSVSNAGSTTITARGIAVNNSSWGGNTHSYYSNENKHTNIQYTQNKGPVLNRTNNYTNNTGLIERSVFKVVEGATGAAVQGLSNSLNKKLSNISW